MTFFYFYAIILTLVLATSTSCPTWHYYNNNTGECECGYDLFCPSKNVEIANGRCATQSQEEGDYYIGTCPFWHPINRTSRMHSEMPSNVSRLDEVMCGPFNRRGLLCGECIEGHGLPVYSASLKCVNCSKLALGYSLTLYLIIRIIPSTFVFLFFVIFQVNITSGPLLGYILYCQVIATYPVTYKTHFILESNSALKPFMMISVALSQFWSTQYFMVLIPPFCISDKCTNIHLILLGIMSAIYPFFLVVVLCTVMELRAKNCKIVRLLWKPFGAILSKTKHFHFTYDAVFHALASTTLLSSISLLSYVQKLWGKIEVYNSTGHLYRSVSYIDPTIETLDQGYPIIAIIIIVCATIIPSFILCIYPTRIYKYLVGNISVRKQLAITAFVEALNSSFKDGLNGSRDYRALAGGIPMLALSYFIARIFLEKFHAGHAPEKMVVIMVLTCVVAFIKPFKRTISNASFVFHMIMLAISVCILYVWENYNTVETQTLEIVLTTISLLPHLLLAVYAGYRFIKIIERRYYFRSSCVMAITRRTKSLATQCNYCSLQTGSEELEPVLVS